MKDYEYEEENLDEFMINAASILSEDNHPEKNAIIESLKLHLSSIFNIQEEMDNFFNTLNGVIFASKSNSSKEPQKLDNKNPFLLYPIIFSFNPRTSLNFINYYLSTLEQGISEENRPDFTFLSEVFADVVTAFYSDEKNNKNLIKKSFLLDPNQKKSLYNKIFNFCHSKIKINKKLEQSFGCLLLTEFIEKCPLVKEDKNLDSLFKILSDYLDDRWFECKVDLLNCTISLIFSAEYKFKPYANVCMFRILDYLTDLDWMIRKLAINIVYTLVFYCKEEIMAFKENIIEFLNILKEDQIEEIREICSHILRYLGVMTEFGKILPEDDPYEMNNESNKPKNIYNKYKNKGQGNREAGSRGEPQNNRINKALNNRNNNNEEIMMQKYQKEKDFLNKMEKENMEKNKNFNITNKSKNTSANNTINNDNSLNRSKKNLRRPIPISMSIDPIDVNSTLKSIFQQIKKIREDQAEFRKMILNLKQAEGNNFISLNERLRALEKNYKNNIRNLPSYYKGDFHDQKGKKNNYNKNEDRMKIEEIREKFYSGKFNEALLETYQNDRYLLKLLPLIDKKTIPKIEIALLEDAISRLNKRINKLVMEGDRKSINDILQFYIQLTQAKRELKLVTQLSINDALTFLKGKGNNILEEEDYNSIETIINSLRV